VNSLLRFLSKYEILFYIVSGLIILISARRTFVAWREWSGSIFGLEKEHSQRRFNQGTIDMTQQPPTVTPAPTVVITAQGIIPTITSYFSRGCIPDQLDWTDPRNGDTISETVELKGTVNVKNLGFYKYEFAPMGSDNWTTIAAGNTIVKNDLLGGAWDTSGLLPGDYELRLVVNDNENNPLPACMIQVTIEAPE